MTVIKTSVPDDAFLALLQCELILRMKEKAVLTAISKLKKATHNQFLTKGTLYQKKQELALLYKDYFAFTQLFVRAIVEIHKHH